MSRICHLLERSGFLTVFSPGQSLPIDQPQNDVQWNLSAGSLTVGQPALNRLVMLGLITQLGPYHKTFVARSANVAPQTVTFHYISKLN